MPPPSLSLRNFANFLAFLALFASLLVLIRAAILVAVVVVAIHITRLIVFVTRLIVAVILLISRVLIIVIIASRARESCLVEVIQKSAIVVREVRGRVVGIVHGVGKFSANIGMRYEKNASMQFSLIKHFRLKKF